jgi:hypothetical protein
VYPSDIKKILNWYNLLQSKGMVSKEEPIADVSKEEIQNQEAEEIKESVVEEVATEKAPSKKEKTKK